MKKSGKAFEKGLQDSCSHIIYCVHLYCCAMKIWWFLSTKYEGILKPRRMSSLRILDTLRIPPAPTCSIPVFLQTITWMVSGRRNLMYAYWGQISTFHLQRASQHSVFVICFLLPFSVVKIEIETRIFWLCIEIELLFFSFYLESEIISESMRWAKVRFSCPMNL